MDKKLSEMCFTGNLAENWKRWQQKFENYVIAEEINKKSEEIQCAQLLHHIGDEGIKIFNSFKFKDNEKNKIKKLMGKFEEHFTPKKNKTFERYKFFKIKQTSTIEQFVTELKNQAGNCEFGDLEEELIKTTLILGLTEEQLRIKLLQNEDRSLEDVIKACQINYNLKNLNDEMQDRKVKQEVDQIRKETKNFGWRQSNIATERSREMEKNQTYRKENERGSSYNHPCRNEIKSKQLENNSSRNTSHASRASDQEAKIVQDRIVFIERTFAELCHVFGIYTRKTARLRDAGDKVSKCLQDFTKNENINKSLSIEVENFVESLLLLNSYADVRVQLLESKVVHGFSLYEEICKHVKEDVKEIYNAREKEIVRKRQLDRIRERSPKSRQQIVQAETALVKASAEVSKSIQNLEEKTNEFEKQKLHDMKSIFLDFISVEIGYHARALEIMTNAYNQINSIDEESDLEEFVKSMGNKQAELKKKQTQNPLFKAGQSFGSLSAIFGTSREKPEGIPKADKYHSEETLDSMKHSISDTENSISITAGSDDDTETDEKSSPAPVRKNKL